MASRKIFVNISSDTPSSAFVKSFTEASQANPIVIARSDSFDLELHFLAVNPIPTPGRPFIYVDPSGWSGAKFAMGNIGAIPDGGTFTLTSSLGLTTGGISYQASAATVQTAVQGLTGLSAATVTSTVTGTWRIDSNQTTNATLAITGSAVALAPDGSTVVIIKTQVANGSLTNRWIIQVTKALPVLNTTWAALASALVTVTTVQVGSSTANKTFRVVWNANAYFGGVLLTFFDATNTFTVGPIPYNAQAADVAAAFVATAAGNAVTVVQNNLGDFTIACTGTNIKGSVAGNSPTLATSSNTLIVPVGYIGTVTASTAGVDDILAGLPSATTYCEVEIRQVSGEPQTVAQINNAVFIADLITNSPGFATGTEDWATIGDLHAYAPHVFADNTARGADVPDHVGQLGYQIDTKGFFEAFGTSAGEWQSVFAINTLVVGSADGTSGGTLQLYDGSSFNVVAISSAVLTGNRTVTFPNASGVVMLSGGPFSPAYVAKTGTYTVTAADGTINCTSGTFTVTLLTAVGIVGQSFTIKNSGAGTITLATTSSQLIDGSLTQTLGPGVSMTVQSTNSAWIVI